MSQHLSSQEILDWMNGEYSSEAGRHVRECPECAAQIERLTDTLAMFRGSVRETAEQIGQGQMVFRMPRRTTAWRWAAAAAALLILASVPIYEYQQNASRQARQKAAELARQDKELMEQVDAELSEGVAAPMKPLEKMVSWRKESGNQQELRKF
jgi:hypothetical protein